jgi:hypothetical protein
LGFIVSPNVPGQTESRASKEQLEALLEARRAKPKPGLMVATEEPAPWEEYWRDLMEERGADGKRRWDWRKALYIAWHCVPTSKRWPKHKYELMDMLGVNDATARKWRQNDPAIDERIMAGPKALLGGHIADVMDALAFVAKMGDAKAHQDRKLFLEMTGQYKPKGSVEVTGEDGEPIEFRNANELSDDELARIATGSGVGVAAPAGSKK